MVLCAVSLISIFLWLVTKLPIAKEYWRSLAIPWLARERVSRSSKLDADNCPPSRIYIKVNLSGRKKFIQPRLPRRMEATSMMIEFCADHRIAGTECTVVLL